ncbi:hypothetical protein Drorol1_Dr00018847 [Drosera rotundifolia]
MMETPSMQQSIDQVIIIGASLSGLATAACLHRLSIPYLILEREDCSASLWRNKAYDRLHLHLPKHICNLPHYPMPDHYPKYVPKDDFVRYLDDYVACFGISPLYRRCVERAEYDNVAREWVVRVKNGEEYKGRFLVVAVGENTDPFIPTIEGLDTFRGKVVHSTEFTSGKEFHNKNVLVIGCGNSGMEIALDLANHGANTSIVVRSPIHVLTREIIYFGLKLLKFSIPLKAVDMLLVMLSKLAFGDLAKYGICRPREGPFEMLREYRKYPVIDVGAIDKIKSRDIQVLPAVTVVRLNDISCDNGRSYNSFDAIVLATGFSKSSCQWLQGDDYLKDDSLSKGSSFVHWKGSKGLYRVGFARRGILGITRDAQIVAEDISRLFFKY